MGLLTELQRRLQLFRHKPRHWRLRPGTIDRRLFREVVIGNDYQLPPCFDPGNVIVDVGSHTGSFAYAALRRGAGTVWCCEAVSDNYRLLEHNLRPYAGRVKLVMGAAWRSDQPAASLAIHNPDDPRNTGANRVTEPGNGETVTAVAFDDLIDRASDGGRRRIRLVKLDCEGSEWPILLTSRRLHLIDAIYGEYHLVPAAGVFGVAGQTEYTPGVLKCRLEEEGFRVAIHPHARNGASMGLFFAEAAYTDTTPC